MNDKILFDKYLELIGVEASNTSFELLCKIVKAHLFKIPFENISKLLYKNKGMNYIPDLATYLGGIEKYNFGGTCYSNNYYLYLLLKHLGYNIILCGADMKNPDVHVISIVTIDGNEFIVDVGYAAPFFEPLPTGFNKDYVIRSGEEEYHIKPLESKGRTKVEQYYNGKLQHWYTANPKPRKIGEFTKVIKDSYADDAMFMNALRITRFSDEGSLVLKNLLLTETTGLTSYTTEISFKNIPGIIQEKFEMPADIVQEAINNIKELKSIYN
jgi:N-hydroxyarylamine O-acetyltransferase